MPFGRSAGWPMACVTNKPVAFAVALLRGKRRLQCCQQVFGGDSFAYKKPAAVPLPGALPNFGRRARRQSDGGRLVQHWAAGCPVLLVTYGYNHGQPVQAADTDFYIDLLTNPVRMLPAMDAEPTAHVSVPRPHVNNPRGARRSAFATLRSC